MEVWRSEIRVTSPGNQISVNERFAWGWGWGIMDKARRVVGRTWVPGFTILSLIPGNQSPTLFKYTVWLWLYVVF